MRRFLPRLIILALTAPLLMVGLPARAATPAASENMTVSPTRIKSDLAPGSTGRGEVSVINDGDTAYDFKVYATPYRVSGEDYNPSFVIEPGATSPAAWIQLADRTYHLEPRQTVMVPYAIVVPAGTSGGGHYATIFYETVPKPSAGSGVQSKERIGVVAYIRVQGAVREQGNVESFHAYLLQKGRPVTATLRLGNKGNVHYTGDVNLQVTDLFGQTKAHIAVSREVLPGTVRRFVLRWEQTPPLGLFRLGGAVKLLGRTEALPMQYVLVLSPGAFWIMLVLLCLLLMLAVWWWVGRRRKR